jgi:hypothetical protein
MRGNETRSEQGSALVMALVMLTVVGLMVAAGLTYAGTSVRASNDAIRPNRASLYAADSAIQGAIEYVRDNPEMSSDVLGATCIPNFFRYTDPTVGEVTVDACPQPDSLIYEGSFRAVLLTLGETDSDGIMLSHNGDVDINGHVWSNSDIELSNPTRMVMKGGRVWAWEDCGRPQNIQMPPGLSPVCNARTNPTFGGVKPKVALDPADPSLGHVADWQPAAAPGSFVQPVIPPCVAKVMTLQPGVYSDGDEFSNMTNACDTVNLSAGVYYLNFPAGKDEWRLDTDVVGPACGADGQGVQIVFADSAHIKLSGTLTIPCGRRATPNGPLIGLYGLKSDLTGGTTQNFTLRPAGATSSTTPAFAPLPATISTFDTNYPVDATPTTASIPKDKSASVVATVLDNVTYPDGLPLTLHVAHSESHDKASVAAVVKEADGSTCTIALTRQASMAVESKPVSCSGFNAIAPFDVTVKVDADKKDPTNAAVDGVELTAAITPQTIKGQNGCVVEAPGTSGYCALVSPPSNGKGNLVVSAVVYIPQSTFAGKFNNSGNFKIGTALIARSLDVDINPNLDGSPVIGEDALRHTNGDVVFTAKISGQEWTSTQVVFPALPNNGIGDPEIKSWVIKK